MRKILYVLLLVPLLAQAQFPDSLKSYFWNRQGRWAKPSALDTGGIFHWSVTGSAQQRDSLRLIKGTGIGLTQAGNTITVDNLSPGSAVPGPDSTVVTDSAGTLAGGAAVGAAGLTWFRHTGILSTIGPVSGQTNVLGKGGLYAGFITGGRTNGTELLLTGADNSANTGKVVFYDFVNKSNFFLPSNFSGANKAFMQLYEGSNTTAFTEGTGVAQLCLVTEGTNGSSLLMDNFDNTASHMPTIDFNRSVGGNPASPTPVTNSGTNYGRIRFQVNNTGSNYNTAALLQVNADGTPSATATPSMWTFNVVPAGSLTQANAFRLRANSNAEFGTAQQFIITGANGNFSTSGTGGITGALTLHGNLTTDGLTSGALLDANGSGLLLTTGPAGTYKLGDLGGENVGNQLEINTATGINTFSGGLTVSGNTLIASNGLQTNTLQISAGTTINKYISATASLNFGSTAASSSSDLTITLTGAAVGDAVILGTANASVLANSCFTAWVSAANTVTVRFLNAQAVGALDPAAGTFKVAIFQ